jgi:UDP-N-acetylmuramate dehydrogenase
MDIRQNESLASHSTMRLGGVAAYAVDVHNRQELQEAIAWAEARNLPIMIIGGGSNVFWRDTGFSGLLVVNRITGYEEQQEDDENWYITVGAGENWDSVVEKTVAKGLTGIEALSLIPGTAGATPIQNVGAYGQDVSQTLVSIEAYDRQTKQLVNIRPTDCAFGYRTSRFKTTDRGRFFITSVTLHLLHRNPMPPFYATVQAYFDEHQVRQFTPQTMREAVIAIRSSKLPDPAVVANNGSFFPNVVADESVLAQLEADYGNVPYAALGKGKIKLYSAWLVEQAGFKDFHDPETGMATWHKQPLVLINEHATSAAQAIAFAKKITDAVNVKFHVRLEQEPELLPVDLPAPVR